MRKTLCFLLLFCLILPLFAAGAYAAKDYTPYIIEVEISAGDTISDICDSYSIDYYAVKDAILVVNGFADEKALGAVSPGQKIFIPRSRADADSIMAPYESTISAVIPSEYVIKVKVEKGETLYSICEAHHLTYSVCREAIKSLNLWSGDFRLDAIYAGQEILLPISDAVAVEISEAVATAVDANINVSTTSGDKFEYYLISHTMASGESVRSVCGMLNVRYSVEVAEMLKTINNLSDLGKVQAGRAYLFPSLSADSAVYAVYAHTVTAGDTVGSLCTAYGVKYADVVNILQGLNPKASMTSIRLGSEFLLVAPCGTGAETPLIIK